MDDVHRTTYWCTGYGIWTVYDMLTLHEQWLRHDLVPMQYQAHTARALAVSSPQHELGIVCPLHGWQNVTTILLAAIGSGWHTSSQDSNHWVQPAIVASGRRSSSSDCHRHYGRQSSFPCASGPRVQAAISAMVIFPARSRWSSQLSTLPSCVPVRWVQPAINVTVTGSGLPVTLPSCFRLAVARYSWPPAECRTLNLQNSVGRRPLIAHPSTAHRAPDFLRRELFPHHLDTKLNRHCTYWYIASYVSIFFYCYVTVLMLCFTGHLSYRTICVIVWLMVTLIFLFILLAHTWDCWTFICHCLLSSFICVCATRQVTWSGKLLSLYFVYIFLVAELFYVYWILL